MSHKSSSVICRSTTKGATPSSYLPSRWTTPLAWVLVACVPWLTLVARPARADTINNIILQVNGEIATLADYKERLLTSELELRRQARGNAEQVQQGLRHLPSTVMGAMFHEMLMLSRAEQLGERVSSAEIDREIQRRRELLQIATDEEFRKRLAQSGLTMESLRASIEQEILIQMVMQSDVFSRINLEENDLRRVWRDNPEDFLIPEQRKLREVVVLQNSGLAAEAMEQLGLELQQKLTDETEAEAIVGDYQERKITSGVIELGWVEKGKLDAALETAVEQLKPGETSPPILGRGGLHVIQLLERQKESVLPFDQVKDQIFRSERGRLYERELPIYLKELEEKSYIVVRPPPGAENFRDQFDDGETVDPLSALLNPDEAKLDDGANSSSDDAPDDGE